MLLRIWTLVDIHPIAGPYQFDIRQLPAPLPEIHPVNNKLFKLKTSNYNTSQVQITNTPPMLILSCGGVRGQRGAAPVLVLCSF
jgi:hypothetical protein